MMTKRTAVVALYDSNAEAVTAVKALRNGGVDMKKLSIVGRDYHTDEHVVGYYNAWDRMICWGKAGAFWGGIWGLLFGSAFFSVPGVGPLMTARPLVAWILGTLEGAIVVGGLSALGAGIYSLGIPKNSVLQYDAAMQTGKFVVIAYASQHELTEAQKIMRHFAPEPLRQLQPVRANAAPRQADGHLVGTRVNGATA
jgi:hypothetical protein